MVGFWMYFVGRTNWISYEFGHGWERKRGVKNESNIWA